MNKFILSLTTVTAISLLFAGVAFADGNCQPIYGGGQTCSTSTNISINKTVQNPTTLSFVDNLSINDPKFSANQNVNFQLTVKNTGNSNIDRTIVKDILPQYINFVSGPGSYDANSRTLSFEVTNLNAGESRTYALSGRVTTDKSIVEASGVVCVVNQGIAQIASNGQTSTDNSQFCIQKGVAATTKGGLPVMPAPAMNTTPSTGPEMAVLPLLSGSGLLGYFLRKKSSK